MSGRCGSSGRCWRSALLSAGGLRAAGWLFALCLPTAVICGALALAGGRSVRALVMAVLSVPIAVFRALPWASRGLAGVRGRTTSSALRVAAAVIVSLVLVLVFGGPAGRGGQGLRVRR